MKKLIFIFAILVSQFANAQNTVWRKIRIAPTLVENYESDKANKKVKLGECFIMNSANRELARGKYKNGLKDSIWNYFSQNGDLIQVYDFTNKKLIYNIPDVSSIVKHGTKGAAVLAGRNVHGAPWIVDDVAGSVVANDAQPVAAT